MQTKASFCISLYFIYATAQMQPLATKRELTNHI